MHLTADQFEYLKVWLEAEIGLVIESDQAFFVASRLYPLITRYGWNDYAPLIARLKDRTEYSLAQDVIESLLTHETSFFRDAHYFDELVSRTLPRIIERRASERRLAIWCAACSTGQEAYSIAMLLRERFSEQLRGWHVEILATDLSNRAIQQARAGMYTEVEVRRGLSDARVVLHFRQDGIHWKIDDRLKQMIQFQQVNLKGNWPPIPMMDLILVRNVLVYMHPSTRERILKRMQQALHSAGHLMLGCSESMPVSGISTVSARSVIN